MNAFIDALLFAPSLSLVVNWLAHKIIGDCEVYWRWPEHFGELNSDNGPRCRDWTVYSVKTL